MTYDAGVEVAKEALNLHRNENQFIDKQWLQRLAAEEASSLNIHQYPDALSSQLRRKLGEIYKIDSGQIYIGNGADGVLADLLQLLRESYSKCSIYDITYPVYPYLLKRYGYTSVNIENDTESLRIIDSPNSLTGEVKSISKYQNGFLVWDNVYGEFSGDIVKTDSADVIIRSFSKFYGMASLRVGYCIADKSLIEELDQRKDVFNVNGMAQALALRLLEEKAYFDSLLSQVAELRGILQKELHALGFEVSNSKANFVWISHAYLSAKAIHAKLIEKGIVVRQFPDPKLSRYLRMAIPNAKQIDYVLQTFKQIGVYA